MWCLLAFEGLFLDGRSGVLSGTLDSAQKFAKFEVLSGSYDFAVIAPSSGWINFNTTTSFLFSTKMFNYFDCEKIVNLFETNLNIEQEYQGRNNYIMLHRRF